MLHRLVSTVEWCAAPPSPQNLIVFMDDGFSEVMLLHFTFKIHKDSCD